MHTIPSGVFHENVENIVGNGVVIDPVIFKGELDKLIAQEPDVLSRLKISRKAHLILPSHRLLDAASEAAKGKKKIGSTLKGIGPTYMDKTGRNGLRVGDIQLENFQELYDALVNKHKQLLSGYPEFEYNLAELEENWFAAVDYLRSLQIIDSEPYMHTAMREGRTILAEGAQGTLLDIDFGTYPFVTSSTTTCAGACTGLGVAPNKIKNVYGIFKAYCTRVGSGPFPTELSDATGETIQAQGHEFGATTGRPRRCGWLDLPALKYAIDVNGVTELMMMKSDVLSGVGPIQICTAYRYKGEVIEHLPYKLQEDLIEPILTELPGWDEDLTQMTDEAQFPATFKAYIDYIEKAVGVPITLVSVGPDRAQTILR
ncbi:MAG: Adenylosuccinate synthetase [Cryomorphaceae bacterium]|nr:MAG: Adenylosuccinate synthetase [Cryomorphaceae bacterium]